MCVEHSSLIIFVKRAFKWISLLLHFTAPFLILIFLSHSYKWRERDRLCIWMSASIGKASSLMCLFWPMLDLRGLISLDNKTKRVNVLIVADGAGILSKCVKLVFMSGPHSSPPCCDLSVPFSPLLFTPESFDPMLFPCTPLHSSCDPVPCFSLFLYIHTRGEKTWGKW